ncbi:hypothetical protein PLESTB_000005300 [Pleodorina starrii]|uniref:Nudix hydrolase domain-containing protein n=1 Tax=Pleodorina starrii TaxID=330485 RepID=A0A9W6EWR3_9CHLO|nr:hypothetical protein PLESTB_000005300 [Pleodorina starrii]
MGGGNDREPSVGSARDSVEGDGLPTGRGRVLDRKDCTPEGFRWLSLHKLQYEDHLGRCYGWEAVTRQTRPSATTGEEESAGGVAVFAKIVSRSWPTRVPVVVQFRPPLECLVIELPAGLVEPGQSAEETALRELREETGFTGHRVTGVSLPLAESPGITDSCCQLALVEVDGDASENAAARPSPEAGELLRCELLPYDSLLESLLQLRDRQCAAANPESASPSSSPSPSSSSSPGHQGRRQGGLNNCVIDSRLYALALGLQLGCRAADGRGEDTAAAGEPLRAADASVESREGCGALADEADGDVKRNSAGLQQAGGGHSPPIQCRGSSSGGTTAGSCSVLPGDLQQQQPHGPADPAGGSGPAWTASAFTSRDGSPPGGAAGSGGREVVGSCHHHEPLPSSASLGGLSGEVSVRQHVQSPGGCSGGPLDWRKAFLEQLSGLSEGEIQAILSDRDPDDPDVPACGGPAAQGPGGVAVDAAQPRADTGAAPGGGSNCDGSAPSPESAAAGGQQVAAGDGERARRHDDSRRQGRGRRRGRRQRREPLRGEGPAQGDEGDEAAAPPVFAPKRPGRSTVGGGGRKGFAGSNAGPPPRRWGKQKKVYGLVAATSAARRLLNVRGWVYWAASDPVALACSALVCSVTLSAGGLALRAWWRGSST